MGTAKMNGRERLAYVAERKRLRLIDPVANPEPPRRIRVSTVDLSALAPVEPPEPTEEDYQAALHEYAKVIRALRTELAESETRAYWLLRENEALRWKDSAHQYRLASMAAAWSRAYRDRHLQYHEELTGEETIALLTADTEELAL